MNLPHIASLKTLCFAMMGHNQDVGSGIFINIYIDAYQPRNPKASAYYRCVEDHFEQLETVCLA
jgi:hypothetical protein